MNDMFDSALDCHVSTLCLRLSLGGRLATPVGQPL